MKLSVEQGVEGWLIDIMGKDQELSWILAYVESSSFDAKPDVKYYVGCEQEGRVPSLSPSEGPSSSHVPGHHYHEVEVVIMRKHRHAQ